MKLKNLKTVAAVLIVISLLFVNGCGEKEFTVKFNTEGGTSVNEKIVKKGDTVIEPAEPVKEGYKFLYWTADGKEYKFDNKINKNITLIAKWEKLEEKVVEHTITFDTAGGNIINSVKVENKQIVQKPTNPTREGYKFIEWTLNDNSYDFNNEVTTDITLIAKWEKVEDKKPVVKPVTKVTVTFNSDGGTKVSSQTINAGSKVNKPADPTKDGYKFLGWYRNNAAWNFGWTTNANITLVAKWEKIEAPKPVADKYTISATTVDDFTVEVLITVYKNGSDITSQVDRIMSGNSTIAKYSSGVGKLKAVKSNYESVKNNILEVVLKDGSKYTITK